MKRLTSVLLGLGLLAGAGGAHAQEAATDRQTQQSLPTPQNFFGLGVGALPKTAGSADLRVMVLPVVQYNYRDVAYISALKAGVWGISSADKRVRVGLFVEPRFGYDAADNPRTAGMADREFALDAGPTLRWQTDEGTVNLDVGFDVTGRSKGQAVQLQFIRGLVRDPAFRLNGVVGMQWQSAAMNNYYFGVSGTEVASGRAAYAPGAGTSFSLGVNGLYAFDASGAMFFGATLTRLSDAQFDSPIVERRYQPVFYLGYGWRM